MNSDSKKWRFPPHDEERTNEGRNQICANSLTLLCFSWSLARRMADRVIISEKKRNDDLAATLPWSSRWFQVAASAPHQTDTSSRMDAFNCVLKSESAALSYDDTELKHHFSVECGCKRMNHFGWYCRMDLYYGMGHHGYGIMNIISSTYLVQQHACWTV